MSFVLSDIVWSAAQSDLLANFEAVSSAEEKLDWLAERPPHFGFLPETLRTPQHQIKQCMSGLWLDCSANTSGMIFRAWSPSNIVLGVVTLICDLFCQRSAAEIPLIAQHVVPALGLERLLSVTRRNSIALASAFIQNSVNLRTYYDAHCHLADERLQATRSQIFQEATAACIRHCVVNGTTESNWLSVKELCLSQPQCLPSFGAHPWFLDTLSPNWATTLRTLLLDTKAGVGEAGLDCYRKPFDLPRQKEVLSIQIKLATELNRPLSLHGLKAWQPLYDLLKTTGRPECGFLLHSYAGPAELVPRFVELGGYFSCPGSILKDSAQKRRDLIRRVPLDRLLVESDAPDQPSPMAKSVRKQSSPADVVPTVRMLAALFSLEEHHICKLLEQNFFKLFGGLVPQG